MRDYVAYLKCDRCGAKGQDPEMEKAETRKLNAFKRGGFVLKDLPRHETSLGGNQSPHFPPFDRDLCDNCAQSLFEWFKDKGRNLDGSKA